MEIPKVLVACPTYKGMKYCHNEFFNALKSLSYPNYKILIIDNSEDNEYFIELKQDKNIIAIKDNTNEKDKILRLISSRNKILQYGKDQNYDYILMMDSDVIPPRNTIEELLSCKKDLVSGLYYGYFVTKNKIESLPIAWVSINKDEFEKAKKTTDFPSKVKSHLDLRGRITEDEANSNKLMKVTIPSAGCMLISKKVIENPKIRYGLLDTSRFGNIKSTDDVYFITKAREEGFDCYCFTKIKCKHLLKEKFKKDKHGNYIHPLYDNEDTNNKEKSTDSISISYNLPRNSYL